MNNFHSLFLLFFTASFHVFGATSGEEIEPFFSPNLLATNGEQQEITLHGQVEVDNFNQNYPDCNSILRLEITGLDITNLNGLTSLEIVSESLIIEETSLSDLEGLEHVNFNDAKNFQFRSNPELLDIVNISYRSDVDTLIISGNSSLLQISNPGFATYGKYVLIDQNESLTSIPFLDNFFEADEVIISNNPQLDECCGLFELIDRDELGSLSLEANGENCNSSQSIREQCGYCFDSHIALRSQEDVDNFRIMHPACKEINDLRISGSDISNLDSLYYLESMDGHDLTIENTSLTNLDGISHVVVDVDFIEILNNPLLESINLPNAQIRSDLVLMQNPALVSLENISGLDFAESIVIESNNALTNLDGLSGSGRVGDIIISGNNSLENLDGLSGLDVRHDIRILDNQSLTSIEGLSKALADRFDRLVIHGNSSLSDCCILQEYFTYEHPHEKIDFEISANALGCTSVEEIENNCNTVQCNVSDVTLTSQADVDAFSTDYPNCHNINSLTIVGTDINNINGLSAIREITNRLEIINTTLSNLSGIEGVSLGFDSDIIIENNTDLEFVGGLYFNSEVDSLIINNNPGLDAIGVFDGLVNLELLEITNNPILSDIIAVEGLEWATTIRIESNHNLNECCPLITLLDAGGATELILADNGSNCSSSIIVREQCGYCEFPDVFLSNQEEVDNYRTVYSACSDIHSLVINGEDITNLDSLYRITSVQVVDITISNTSITSLGALSDAIIDVGHLIVANNPLLESLEFNNRFFVYMGLEIIDNASLTHIEGMQEIDRVDFVTVSGNNSLMNLDFLSTLHSADFINISDNISLTNIEGLGNLEKYAVYNIVLHGNSSLSECCVLEELFGNEHGSEVSLDISTNAQGCNSQEEITNTCSSVECEFTDLVLTTQAEVDAFPITYPGCTEFQSLIIEGEDITSLDSLYQIENISFEFTIDNTNVTRIAVDLGSKIENLIIRNNPQIGSLRLPQPLINITGEVVIENNDLITHIDIFYPVETIKSLVIDGNDNLIDIDYFNSLISINELSIINNQRLSNCCEIKTIMRTGIDSSNVIIENNDDGCTSIDEVIESCICPNDELVIFSQQDIDDLKVFYPDCKTIRSLSIQTSNSEVHSLLSLDGLLVTESLRIFNTDITSLEGVLVNLELDELVISNNSSLRDLNAISNLVGVNTSLRISRNGLTNLDALSNLKHAGVTFVEFNPELINIDGLASLESIEGLSITRNEMLSDCCILYSELSTISNSSFFQIRDNAIGCRGINEIAETCEISDCGIDRVSLNSQEDVDNFLNTYGECDFIPHLVIAGNDIVSLESMRGMNPFRGTLQVSQNELLESLEGLELSPLVRRVDIFNNQNLKDLKPFESVTNVLALLLIEENDMLTDVDDFLNLSRVGEFVMRGNDGISSLQGMVSLNSTLGLRITNNSLLSDCCIIDDVIDFSTFVHDISGNNLGCRDLNEIQFTCSESPCESEVIVLSNQEEVDAFPLNHPNCHTINWLTIEGSDIRNLDSLYQMRRINGSIQIINTSIEYIQGLNQVVHAEDIYIENNTLLKTVRGLENIADLPESLTIRNNDALQDLSGVNFIESVGAVFIENNDLLTQIDDFQNLQSVGLFTITNNASLSECCIVEQLLSLGLNQSNITVENNAERCTSYEEVRTSCNINSSCEFEDLRFSNQQEIDEFPINHANCTEIRDIYIEGSDITNLESLGSIERIYGDVSIHNTSLTTLNGLNIDREIYSIHIGGNQFLTDLSPLNNVGATKARIIISNNASLEHLDALSNLTFNGDAISIHNNASLASIDGLSNLSSLERFYAVDNPNLNECCFINQKIDEGVNIDGLTLSGNAEGCMSLENIIESCDGGGDNEGNNGSEGRDDCSGVRITLRSQEDVDNFGLNYPNCDIVSELVITGLSIENLDGLSKLIAVNDYLRIDETSLPNLSGLAHVDLLTLQEVIIIENQFLGDLFGLTIPDQLDRLIVSDNPLLINIDNLESLSVYDYLEVYGNSSLSECCPVLAALSYKEGRMVIRNNASGCSSIRNIEESCEEIHTVDCTEIILFSQADIDNFERDFPNCTSTDILHLDGIDIENLDGIAALREVSREIYVGSTQLTDLAGLQNISFENLEIVNFFDNNQLENLEGFNLTGHVQEMSIDENEALTNLSGLEALQSANHLGFSFNNSLMSLSGLEGLTDLESLIITENPELENINALSNLSGISFGDIFQNVSLAECCVLLPFLEDENSSLAFGDNATGCSFLEEIIDNCKEQEVEIVECDNEIVVLTSQEEVDDFAIKFAGCNSINALDIKGSDITNLDGLRHLVQVRSYISISRTSLDNLDELSDVDFSTGEYLILQRNPELSTISGLNCAQDMKHIKITDNDNLTNLDGLNKLVHSDYMAIENNNSLINLSGLENVLRIDRFTISNNQSLISLDGLSELESVQTLSVYFNPLLRNIDALSRLIDFELMHFNFNEALSECCGLKLAIENRGDDDFLLVRDNAAGCLSVDDITATCTDQGFAKDNSSLDFDEVNTNRIGNEFKVFPNPFEDKLIVKKPIEVTDAVIRLYNIQGSLIMTERIDKAEKIISTTQLSTGIYLVKIKAADKVQTFKMVKN